MLLLTVPLEPERWDEDNEEFIPPKTQELRLEHSLVSLSKWESKWCKPFLSQIKKTDEETLDYIRFMTITQNVNPDTYYHLNNIHIKQIEEYISAPMSAAKFKEDENNNRSKLNGEIITAETLYWYLITLQIPFECQKWHLNRLVAFIRFCCAKNEKPRPMTAAERKALNEARKKKHNTRG